jgi:hypothetical protein
LDPLLPLELVVPTRVIPAPEEQVEVENVAGDEVDPLPPTVEKTW